jgi:Tfp pilus assembly protein PilN
MARQQLNLYDARFSPQSLRFSARHGLWAVAAVLALSVLGTQGLRLAASQAGNVARQADAATQPLAVQVAALGASAAGGAGAELQQLQALEAGQRRIRSALEAGAAGAREGHADYLVALARQASGSLWLTGFAVSEDGAAIELEGRMTDTAVLTDYLRRLNAEPRFKGRPFAQLNLKSSDGNGVALPYTEFSLRSTAIAATAVTP